MRIVAGIPARVSIEKSSWLFYLKFIFQYGEENRNSCSKTQFSSVRVKIQLKNQLCTDQKVVVRGQISGEGLTETAEQSNILIDGGSSTVAELNLWVQKPRLWDVDDPYLYSLSLELLSEGTTVQKLQNPIWHTGVQI